MSEFSNGVRKFWLEVAAWKFGKINGRPPEVRLEYSEERGFRIVLDRPADEVHHIIPGSWAEANGQLANEQVGLPVSRYSHRGSSGLPYTEEHSYHPDMQEAWIKYRKGDKKAYEKASARHKADSLMGYPPKGFEPSLAAEMTEIMRQAAVEFIAATGRKKPMSGKERPAMRHWSDGLFD